MLRAPIFSFMGHIDAGKTSLLDRLQNTKIAQNECGKITQKISSMFLDNNDLESYFGHEQVLTNGLLLIDTPGHDIFVNLQKKGIIMSDLVVLVVNIINGLEKQTIEILNLLKENKCPFVILLNKIDKIYGWQTFEKCDIQTILSKQNENSYSEFISRVSDIKLQLSVNGMNSELFYNNTNQRTYISLYPVSAKTGDGINDFVKNSIKLTIKYMQKQIRIKNDFEAILFDILQYKNVFNVLNIILINGTLNSGDNILLHTLNGGLLTQIKYILDYQNEVSGVNSINVLITNGDINDIITGTDIYKINKDDDNKQYYDLINKNISNINSFLSDDGISIQCSSYNVIESIINFTKIKNIPVGHIGIGSMSKKHILYAKKMAEQNKIKYSCIISFSVHISNDIRQMIRENNITLIEDEIIYKLFDKLTNFITSVETKIYNENKEKMIFPVKIKVLKCFFCGDYFLLGCEIIQGSLHINTPLINMKLQTIGNVQSIQINGNSCEKILKGEFAVKIDNPNNLSFGRHINGGDILVSKISRESIDALKICLNNKINKSDIKLIKELKILIQII